MGACGLPCPNELKDISKLDPYVKVEVRGMETFKKQTRTEKDSGANVIWNSSLRFPKVLDDLVFVRYGFEGTGVDLDSYCMMMGLEGMACLQVLLRGWIAYRLVIQCGFWLT